MNMLTDRPYPLHLGQMDWGLSVGAGLPGFSGALLLSELRKRLQASVSQFGLQKIERTVWL